jgi:hypothetical protein
VDLDIFELASFTLTIIPPKSLVFVRRFTKLCLLLVLGERKHKFSAGSNNYTLCFDDMHHLYQQNDRYGTKRDVRRRPAKYLDEKLMKQVLEE